MTRPRCWNVQENEARSEAVKHEITTAGKLREALEGIPDDTPIWTQTCGQDKGAWSMFATLGDIPAAQPRKLVIALRHPDLSVLPDWPETDAQ